MADKQVVRVSIESVPEAMAILRREMALMLRREAGLDPNPACVKKLRMLADAFEAGLGPMNDEIWRKP